MDIQTYQAKLDQLSDPTSANLVQLGEWVQTEAIPWLWDELAGVILTPKSKHPKARTAPPRPTLKPMSHAEAVRQGLLTSAGDWKKLQLPSFYRAQLTMLDSEAGRYCQKIAALAESGNPLTAPTVHSLHQALIEMMRLTVALLEDAARELTELPGYFASWRRPYETSFEVFMGAEQFIYGAYSGMAYPDRAPYSPCAVLRTAIELRLRYAFCVSHLVCDENPEEIFPINLSKLFEGIQEHQDNIDFEVDLHDVWKVYRWSNFYLHGGRRDFPWVPGFLLQYLRPLFVGQRAVPNQPWSINSGIRMSRSTWQSVRSSLQPCSQKRSIVGRLKSAWSAFLQDDSRRLTLPRVNEDAAECLFLE